MRPLQKSVLVSLLAGSSAWASVVFEADFESGMDANTGMIFYGAGYNVPVAVTGGSDATLGSQALLADPVTGGGGDPTLILWWPTSTVSLTGGQSAMVSLDVVWRRGNGYSKSHYLTGYDSNDSIIFQFVMGELDEFGNGSADRQRPGYADSSGAYTFAGKIASGVVPGSYWCGADVNPADGLLSTKDAHFDITLTSDGWSLYTLKQNGITFAQTTTLGTYDGGTYSELAYVTLTGESAAAGAYFDNLKIQAIPEPATLGMLALMGGGILWIRRLFRV